MRFIRGFLVFILLVGVVVGSFWVSFLLGKRILVPLKQAPLPKIEVTIPEPPPEIQALQEMAKETPAPESVKAVASSPVKKTGQPVNRSTGKHYFKVQAGLFRDKGKAQELGEDIKAKGFDIYIKKVGVQFRVQVGAFRTRSEAEIQQNSLSKNGFSSTIVYE